MTSSTSTGHPAPGHPAPGHTAPGHPALGHPALELPPEERTLSPHTGYTRAHWEAAADGLLRAAWQWATPGRALLDLPGRPSGSGVRSDGLEGYARTFLAAAFRVAGAGGADPHGWLDRYADGLAAGTRTPGRDDTESWPLILDHHIQGQPMVESASVAIGLRLTRPWLWDRLDPDVRDRAEEWLRGALRHTPAPNNWYLFPYSVAGFLESVGRGDAETARARERALDLLEGWYRGQGWYADGDSRAFDHYNGWALHLYPVLDAHLARGEKAGGKEAGGGELPTPYGARLREYLEGFSLLFGGDGAPIHFGRSLNYRFAAGAAVALGAVTGHTPLTPGVSRRLVSGALRYFLDRGASGTDGLLSLGWHGPHDATLQRYSGPASPYWASKAFVALLAPEDHPLWTATEEPAPGEGPDRVLALPAPGLLVQSTRADGIVRLHNHGSDHIRPHEGESGVRDDPHYSRQAYSTRTGPTAVGNVADNHLSVEIAGEIAGGSRGRPAAVAGSTRWAPEVVTAGAGRPPGTGRSSPRARPWCRGCGWRASPWSGAGTNCGCTAYSARRPGRAYARRAGRPARRRVCARLCTASTAGTPGMSHERRRVRRTPAGRSSPSCPARRRARRSSRLSPRSPPSRGTPRCPRRCVRWAWTGTPSRWHGRTTGRGPVSPSNR